MTEMIRGTFKYNPETKAVEPYEKPAPIEVDAPTVFKDECLDGIHSMADDKIYYSKSAYRRSLEKLGYEEVGITGHQLYSEFSKARDKTIDRLTPNGDEIREVTEKAYYDIKYDRVEFTEKQKQLHKEEEQK